MKQLFIYTRNEKMKDKLLANGFTLLHELKGCDVTYVFANNGTYTFDKDEMKELIFKKELFL